MKVKTILSLLITFFVANNLYAQQDYILPNLIRNSYMDILDGSKPAGYSTYGNVVIEAVHPFTKGFEGISAATKPANAALTVDDATAMNPYWFGVYNKGGRIARGGLADGWNAFTGGNILKITGDNAGGSTSVFFPFERNVLIRKVRFRAWVKIVKGEFVGFGNDSGLSSTYWGTTFTKQTTDQALDKWYFIDMIIQPSQNTSLNGLVFSMGIKGSPDFEVYLALPHLSIEGANAWLPSVTDMISRNGLTILPQNGYVGIGTKTPKEELSVNGKIRAKEIKVENTNWPDYVFTLSYNLPSLQETEQHIKEKGHLPGIPSAEEVKNNGVDLGEMNAKLLQKIEELTLHLIRLEKQNGQQQKAIEVLQSKIKK
ncbi:prefoldin domain-containing protein [Solitalea canadensis]|uniref:Uncharacterized protein n=1 Tax=Solitalea canadensis (strain ATCC 29591 / DSM 3403 / JCM 21819 / LMG 8368 / NBRC 15130 / NCIMB 12057 / USAM 9D) TaxID=929556 RepID=H8KTR7_SOLCM|nr:hypothetical protein [Solitalea canadensis]AFD06642.1 hypothetical protein Solca_1569 [Solitalea canadensis DSM 3403]